MKETISLCMITKNAAPLLERSLKSVKGLVDEIVIVDDHSTDRTRMIAAHHKAKLYEYSEGNLADQRRLSVQKATGTWILVLDSDEIISPQLAKEIRVVTQNKSNFQAYLIPFQTHLFGKPLYHGGENYSMIRLLKKSVVVIDNVLVHEAVKIKKGNVGKLSAPIYHYSYTSLWQMYKKFTQYALWEAEQKKLRGEKTNIKKIILYPIHMFYARFIQDKGYKDGLFRIPLDVGFAYMELVTYVSMLFIK